ncbi:MAG: PfkB family carbohydrate kinase [Opitutales bacterium]|nr:PfkB family carbohydrate kinase [Opitutales bacterium]
MEFREKEISFKDASIFFCDFKKNGRKIVQCHGTFDLVHPGHVVHFEEAKALGDVLVVTLTDEKHVNKGPGRPYFNNELRVKSLSALEMIDYVVVIPHPAAIEAIETVRPDVYCKGKEYAADGADVTGNFADDVTAVEKCGGKVAFVGDVVFSSTKLINQNFTVTTKSVKEFCEQLAQKWSSDDFVSIVDGFQDLKVLVIGDIILDRYSTVSVQGLTSKNRMLSGRFMDEETQAGGALAIFRHLKEFTNNLDLFGFVGQEPWIDEWLKQWIPEESDAILRMGNRTIIKQRFVEPIKDGKEMSKLFSVNFIDSSPPSDKTISKSLSWLEEHIDNYDLVVAADFGHGVMAEPIRSFLQEKAKFLSVNCQTNSNNYGFNIINKRWVDVDCFSLDRKEMALAIAQKDFDLAESLTDLKSQLNAKYAWLTLGDEKTICVNTEQSVIKCAPFETKVVDTIGAGDAFFALASLAAVKNVPLEMATFIAQIAGALAVKIVGNRDCIRKGELMKSGVSLLNV